MKENIEEKTKDKESRLCIVKQKGYDNFYYGEASYGSELSKAKVFEEENIPPYIKNDPEQETIFLDTERGLEMMVKEVEKLQHYINIEKPRVIDVERRLDKLKGFENVNKYLELHRRRYNDLIGMSEYEKKQIIKEVIANKDSQ